MLQLTFILGHKMKNILILLVPILIILLYGGCSNSNNELVCNIEEMQTRFANTDCIAEELVFGCTNIFCRSEDASAVNFDENCSVVDCETLECERIELSTEPIVTTLPGFMTDLNISDLNGLPTGNFLINDMEILFGCGFIQNQ